MNNSYDLLNLQFRAPAGIVRQIQNAAADLGVPVGTYLRAVFRLRYDDRCRYGLSVRLPGPESIGIVGRAGRIVGTLQAVREGRATIDGLESSDPADRVSPVIVDWSDLVGEGGDTRLSPTRKRRLPGRRRSIKVARARAAVDALAGDTPADAR